MAQCGWVVGVNTLWEQTKSPPACRQRPHSLEEAELPAASGRQRQVAADPGHVDWLLGRLGGK